MMLIVADVISRNLLATPIIGVAEISARSVGAIVFLLLPSAALNGALIRSDFLLRGIELLSPRALHLLDTLFGLAGAGIFALVAIAAWPDTHDAWMSSDFFGVRGVWTLPTVPFHLLVVIGGAATSLAFTIVAADCAMKMLKPGRPLS
ncbi:TRAP transporter small permease subunit [Leisingera sp. XS_AS12]|uniref:TRAP transporter small permease subunit n=1 Tax=Leisingera sp. XS_AS12 TaxID=3241294 RepID=UPI0035154E9B